ncbi:hypothetical protein BH10PLA1_BH10PLA1_06570 [soil metagenome]
MTCEETQSVLLDPQDPAVDRQQLLDVASHAMTCDACRRYAADLNRLDSALHLPGEKDMPVPRGGYDAFEERLLKLTGAGQPTRQIGSWMSYAAAAVLGGVIAGAYFLGAQQGAVHTEKAAITPHTDAHLVFSPSEVRHSSLAFAEVSEAFENRASWVLTGDRAADVGVEQTPIDRSHPVLLLKLVLRSGGEILSRGDLAIVSGRSARVTLPLEDGKKVRYSISTQVDQPDRLGISAELLDSNGSSKPLAALSTRMQPQSGKSVRAGEMSTNAGDYEVIVSFAQADTKDRSE